MKLIALLLCLGLASCVKPVDCVALTRLEVGSATLADAIALLGQPASTAAAPDGTVARWVGTRHLNTGGSTTTGLKLTFGPDGRLRAKDCATQVTPPLIKEPAA